MILTAVLILSFFLAAGVLHVTGMGSHFKSILTCNQALHNMFVFERSFPDTRKTLPALKHTEANARLQQASNCAASHFFFETSAPGKTYLKVMQ